MSVGNASPHIGSQSKGKVVESLSGHADGLLGEEVVGYLCCCEDTQCWEEQVLQPSSLLLGKMRLDGGVGGK